MVKRPIAPLVAVAGLTGYAVLAHGGYLVDNPRQPHRIQALFQDAKAAEVPLKPGPLLIARNTTTAPLALDRRHLVWEKWPRADQGSAISPKLVQQNLPTGPKVVLARKADQFGGLASTSDWVVYASLNRRSVVAVRHDGSRRIVLGRSLATPIATRADLVAWGEDNGTRQRVIVRDMATGVRWVAADTRRCNRGHCYRIDGVTLAEQGVVYARGAIGSGPSFIVRRRFSDVAAQSVALPNDPQPDLAPSSAGALYYALGAGWFRWDFGTSSPQRILRSLPQTTQIVASEHGTFFLLERRGCDTPLLIKRGPGRPRAVASLARLRSFASIEGRSCVQFAALVTNGSHSVTTWVVVPNERSATGDEEDADYASVVFAGR